MRNNRLCTEGLFRIQGNEVDIREYQTIINKTGDVNFPDEFPAVSVANIITRFIGCIPGHLLEDKNAEAWNNVRTPEQAKELINKLPIINKALLSRIMAFFRIVAKKSAETRMDAHCIATILSPTLVTNPKNPQYLLSVSVCTMLIEQYENIFDSIASLKNGGFIPSDDFHASISDQCNEFFCQYKLNQCNDAKHTRLSRNFEIPEIDPGVLLENLMRVDSKSENAVNERQIMGITPL